MKIQTKQSDDTGSNTCFNRCTRNKFNLTWCPLPFTVKKGLYELKKNKQMFSDVRHHSIILKKETQNKTMFDSWLLYVTTYLCMPPPPTACKLNCCSFLSQSFLKHHTICASTVHLLNSAVKHQPQHRLYMYGCGQKSLQNHTEHKVQYLPSEQHSHYFKLSCA